MSTAIYLEEAARQYALKAVKADQKGEYESAAKYYEKAADILERLIRLYPDIPFKETYVKMIREYRRRSKHLREIAKRKVKAVGGDEEDEEVEVDEIILTQKPSITFDDIVDLEEVKQAIREAIVYPVKRPDLFPLGWPRGILLFGPPGCGKTMVAAAVANEIDGVFFHVDAATIMSKWLGEAEKNVSRIFRRARVIAVNEGKPAIIFIDEVDALLGVYQTEVGGEVRVRNQFLKEMDGIMDKSFNYHVYVIGATNKPWRLDEAFIRRFQKRIYVPPPNFEARIELFKYYTSKIKLDETVDLVELAKLTEGYSASDIRDIVQAAHMRTIREFFEKNNGIGEPRPVSMDDFMEILKVRKPSIDHSMIEAYVKWYEKFKAL